MPSSTPRSVSAETSQAVERLVETQEFAFADVAPDGRLNAVNPFGRLCLNWSEGQTVPEEVLLSLEGIPADATAVLPIRLGGLTVTGIRRGVTDGWVVVGYEAPGASQQALDRGMFDDFVERMPVPVFRMTLDGTVLYANAAMEGVTGYDGDELRAARFWDRSLLPAHLEAFDKALHDAWHNGAARAGAAFMTRSGAVRNGTFFLHRGEGYHVEAVLIEEPETTASSPDARSATFFQATEPGPEACVAPEGDASVRAVGDGDQAQDCEDRFRDAASALREVATSSPDLGVVLDATCRILGEAVAADRVRVVVPFETRRPIAAASWSGDESWQTATEYDRETLFVIGDRTALYMGPDPASEGAALAGMHPIDEACWIRIPSVHADAFVAVERLPANVESRPCWSERERSGMQGLVDLADVLCSWIGDGSRYRRLVRLLDDVCVEFRIDEAGERRYSHAGEGIVRLTGIPAERWLAVAGEPACWISELVHPDDRPAVRSHDHVLGQGIDSTATYRLVLADGTVRLVSERAHASYGPGGMVSVVAVLSETTERRAASPDRDGLKDVSSGSIRRQNALVATLSHEVRTPMGALHGYAELLLRELSELGERGTEVPPALLEFATAIEDRARRLTSLVQDMFDLSSIELGHASVHRAPVSLHDVVTRSAARQSASLRDKGLTIRLQLDSRNPRVLSDSRRLEQVFDGLLSNAVKFTEAGSITVRTRAGKREVVVEVEDTGIGIAPEFQDRIFLPFTQEEEWRSRRYDGTGLGLSLVKRLLDLLGGRIEVESRKNVGSTFRVFLPMLRGPVSRGAVMPRAERG